MYTSFDPSLPANVRLLLRADAEQVWLHREVIPVLCDLETRATGAAPRGRPRDGEELPDELLGAALAYLEAMWDEATLRAHATDAARAHLCSRGGAREALSVAAERYHTAVRALRGIVAERVTPFVEGPLDIDEDDRGLRVRDARPGTGGCAPRAA
jgi:hypothetical protein